MDKLNPNITKQQSATDINASVWVFASAGSGKTKVLIDRILNLLLAKVPPYKILCLTYTKAASSEMKTRISDKLKKWVVMPQSELAEEIEAITANKTNVEQINWAKSLFAKVVDESDNLKIFTIHAFCQSLLKRFPIEAGVNPNFSVIDDLTATKLHQEACSKLLQKAYSDASISEALNQVSSSLNRDNFLELINIILANNFNFEQLREQFKTSDNYLSATHRFYDFDEKATIASLWQNFCQDCEKIKPFMLNLATTLKSHKNRTPVTAGEGIECFFGNPTLENLDNYKSSFLTDNRLKSNLTKCLDENLLEDLEREKIRILNFEDRLASLEIAINSRAMLILEQELNKIYTNELKQKNVLDYNDLIIKSIKFLSNSEVNPWVMYKLDGGIDHVLVDEAQDTSKLQWQIIKLLTQDFFVQSAANIDMPKTIFAVGDKKQSIYSFQGAAPQIFIASQDEVKQQSEAAGYNFKTIPLQISFRSAPAVLDVVNAIFSLDENASGVRLTGEDITHVPYRAKATSKVQLFIPLEIEEKKEADFLPINAIETEESDSKLARLVAYKIHKILADKTYLSAKKRYATAADILVLVKKRTPLIGHLIKNLQNLGISVAGADRINVLDNLAVKDLIAFAQIARLPEDDLTLACVLKSPLLSLTEDDLFELSYNRAKNETLYDRLKTNPKFKATYSIIEELRVVANNLAPYDFFETILEKYNYRENMLKELGEEGLDATNEFLNLALNYQTQTSPNLADFVATITQENLSIKRENNNSDEENAAIRIMTVHSSKGLQAPIVIIPQSIYATGKGSKYFENMFFTSNGFFWSPSTANYNSHLSELFTHQQNLDSDENRRLLYVALTRAEDEIYIFASHKKREDAKNSWYYMIKKGMEKLSLEPQKDEFLSEFMQTDIKVFTYEFKGENPENLTTSKEPQNEFKLPSWLHDDYTYLNDIENNSELEQSPMEANSQSYERGKIIHHLLEYISYFDIQNFENKAQEFLTKQGLTEEDATTILSKITKLLENANFAKIFSPQALIEAPIYLKDDAGNLQLRRLDRVLVTDEEVLILDYKTNRIAPQNLNNLPATYVKQMREYKDIMAKIYPNKKIRGIILFIESMSHFEI
jgi:ATP-dependent helicase/nuclease subunit A